MRCRIRLADGRLFAGELAPERHRALQLGMLHTQTAGFVELAAGVRRDGRLQITTRRRRDHFLPGGGAGGGGWLDGLLELAERHAARGEEVFVAPAARSAARGEKQAVSETRFLWVDVDRPGQLHALWAFLAERPCHMLIESGGSGGCHAYFRLAEPLPATRVVAASGELVEPIERANLRIIHRLGVGEDGRPTVAGGKTYWPGTDGHITGLKYSFTYPGGPDKASFTLEVPPSYRSRMLDLGATVRIFRGGGKIWEGRLDEPQPSSAGQQVTAVGVGNLAAEYLASYSAWPSGQPDEVINNAIGRGLPWVNPTVGQPSGIWLGQAPDNYARTVKDVLDLCCTRGGLGWYVNCQAGLIGNDITITALPTVPTRLLTCTTPVARTVGGDVKAVFIRYQSAADNVAGSAAATYAVTSVTNTGHGGEEVYLDLSNAGVMSSGVRAGCRHAGTENLSAGIVARDRSMWHPATC